MSATNKTQNNTLHVIFVVHLKCIGWNESAMNEIKLVPRVEWR